MKEENPKLNLQFEEVKRVLNITFSMSNIQFIKSSDIHQFLWIPTAYFIDTHTEYVVFLATSIKDCEKWIYHVGAENSMSLLYFNSFTGVAIYTTYSESFLDRYPKHDLVISEKVELTLAEIITRAAGSLDFNIIGIDPYSINMGANPNDKVTLTKRQALVFMAELEFNARKIK